MSNSDLISDKPLKFVFMGNIFYFLKDAWKITAIAMGFGLFFSIIYLLITPKKYEAIAQVRMAQISITNTANPFGISVEDPSSLIARMKMPTNYNAEVLAACRYENTQDGRMGLASNIKLSPLKGMANTVEYRILAESSQIASECLESIFYLISSLQAEFARPFIEEAKQKLAQDNERIDAAKRLIGKADRTNQAMSAVYLSARDEISYFLTDREKMIDLINSAEQRGTKLISPIFAPDRPVSPKKFMSLLSGLMAGFLLGLSIVLLRQWLRKAKL